MLKEQKTTSKSISKNIIVSIETNKESIQKELEKYNKHQKQEN